ncbi:MAG TPA: S-methyl-5-thioribose-1-phosphate isomerase [Hellea balneolensis]|uniref:S-methyl-5-thioribose-1-phosphate isomerase n=1 Tax=Hellea balneolensis TaxID=287478 RepID=A0A7C3GA02_9PROT|nr:S-methyl-5-thioribose-1-phosphate isomerase [Hellea balneolensis]
MVTLMTDKFDKMVYAGTDGIDILPARHIEKTMSDPDTLLVDVRDPRERERDGCIAGAYAMPRGMTEFWMHRDSPYFKSVFAKKSKFVFICAKGLRAVRAAQTARELGYESFVLQDGISGWRDAGLDMVMPDGSAFYTPAQIHTLLPHILRRENIARYENGKVLIGNRAQYPFEKSFVSCASVEDVAVAIETMVTQGVGPWVAAVHALALRSDQIKDGKDFEQGLKDAAARLIKTRPTNTLIRQRLGDVMNAALRTQKNGDDPTAAILIRISQILDQMYKFYARRAQYGAKLIQKNDGVLTMCFAESSFVLAMAMAKDQGKSPCVYVPETRPYLQGARLTAPSLHEIGIDVKLITDNMPAALMAEGKINIYMTAADLITLDGHVVNKVGTFQNAICARHHAIPYYAFAWGCDKNKPDRASIEIEYRNPDEIKDCRGTPTTRDDIDAVYPAFDITPPEFVAGIITRHGVKSPYDLRNGFE